MRTRLTIAILASLALLMSAVPASAHRSDGRGGFGVWRDLFAAARVSAEYHSPTRAQDDGYVPFAIPADAGGTPLRIGGDEITCFDSDAGGMGVHYVQGIDEYLDPADPEALVYSVGENDRLRLVALEYVIPEEFVNPSNPPVLFGRAMHGHAYLPIYILHVWIWKWNPSGLFADFNPRVAACPTP